MHKFQGKAAALLIASAATVGTLAMSSPASAATSGQVAVASQDSAARAVCSSWRTIRTSQGKLIYKECRTKVNGRYYSKVDGRVDDTRPGNGRCVYATIRIGSYKQTERDCGTGYNNFKTGWKRGADARVTLG
ncbi:hypothetical protein J7I98_14995 [Streptomyces sp. ISL-98]|uniref:hypothetical protein n=1 Tax=Streptomyces sp. ISL-98 TaxID=2819192 RepID=UPI001BEBBBC0|nr:hypothetical protein [Streptomyces sp. ISL-98]MBT2507173.1 hypothetical protein [Streptomyces sp. ISL-98]